MKKVFVPSTGVSDWRRLLGDPEKHWKRGRSAFETAIAWEQAASTERGLPGEVLKSLDALPDLAGARLLLAIPEHKVSLAGRGKPSQNDVWALLKTRHGLVSLAVEAKAGEPFDVTLSEWTSERGAGREERLRSLCDILQIARNPPGNLRYQLFHRAASALLEAERFGAHAAVMMVQSFANGDESWRDFAEFADALGAELNRGDVGITRCANPVPLYLGWVDCKVAADEHVASATM